MKTRRLFVLFTALATVLTAAGAASGAPPDHSAASEHARIVAYWTPERVAHATPMVITVDPTTGRRVPAAKGGNGGKPGGGGGGGGGGGCNPKKGCAPTVSLSSPAGGATVSGSVTISGTAADQDGSVVNVSVSAAGVGLDPVTTTDGFATWSIDWDSTTATDGSQQITATATDDSGRSTSTSITVTVANDTGGGSTQPTVTGAHWPGSADGNARTTTGRVLFTLNSGNYVCSGTLVDANTSNGREPIVLTAGHCSYAANDGGWARNWMFVPDYESQKTFTCANTEYGCWTAQSLTTSSEWVASEDFRYDAAFAHLNPGGKSSTDQTPITDVITASQGLSFTSSLGGYVTDFGYPAASPYNGQTLTYCAGTTETDPYGGGTQGLLCDMTGGSSGGAWLSGFDYGTELGSATSVNSYKYRQPWDTGRMYGPIFGNWTNSVYTAALAAKANGTAG